MEPNLHRPAHSHDFDARVMVLEDRSHWSSARSASFMDRGTPAPSLLARCTRNIRKRTGSDIFRAAA